MNFLKIRDLYDRERPKREKDHKGASFSKWTSDVEERRQRTPLLTVF